MQAASCILRRLIWIQMPLVSPFLPNDWVFAVWMPCCISYQSISPIVLHILLLWRARLMRFIMFTWLDFLARNFQFSAFFRLHPLSPGRRSCVFHAGLTSPSNRFYICLPTRRGNWILELSNTWICVSFQMCPLKESFWFLLQYLLCFEPFKLQIKLKLVKIV
jgi:hypothetical protein